MSNTSTIICSAQVHCLTWDERKSGATAPPRLPRSQSGRSKMSESRRGRERNDLKSATLCPSCLTGKEEVFAAVPEGLFTELLCAVTAAAEVKGMDLGLGIKAGCFRARRGERLRADEDDGGEPQTGSLKNSAGSRRIFRPKLDEGSSAGGRREARKTAR